MRYIQDPVTHKLIPADQYVRPNKSASIHDDIKPFISPVDGSVIGSNADLRNHNARHNVVQQLEYGEVDRSKRDDHYLGKRTTAESFKRKQEIHETINRMERENG